MSHCACMSLCMHVAQSCRTLCDPMDCSLPGSSVHGGSPGKNIGVGCHALLHQQLLMMNKYMRNTFCSSEWPNKYFYLVVQWIRLCSQCKDLGLIPDQGTRSHMPQLRVCIWHSQINKNKYLKEIFLINHDTADIWYMHILFYTGSRKGDWS